MKILRNPFYIIIPYIYQKKGGMKHAVEKGVKSGNGQGFRN